jgi:hypothetical protein
MNQAQMVQVRGRSGIVDSIITETRFGDGQSSYMIMDTWQEFEVDGNSQKTPVQKGCSILAIGPSSSGFEIVGNAMSAYYPPHLRVVKDLRFKIESMCPNPT